MNKKVLIWVLIGVGIVVALVGVLVAIKFLFSKNSNQTNNAQQSTPQEVLNNLTGKSKRDNLPKIFNLGINLAPYDKATGMAGDVKFANIRSQYWEESMFEHYGFQISGNENNPDPGYNIHPEYFLPVGTKIFAVSEGTVQDVPKIYSGDYSILVTQDDAPAWTLNYEHVLNPLVKKGDKLKVGQPIAEVSNLQMESLDPSYGKWALQVFKGGQNEILTYCPYLLFDESVKAEMQAKVTQFISDWEEFIGKDVYDEETWVAPGCKFEKMTESQAKNGQIN